MKKPENKKKGKSPLKEKREFAPPLDPETMARLRKGFGSIDEHFYYFRTEEFYLDMQDELKYHEAQKKLEKPSKKIEPIDDDEDDVPF